MSATAPAALTVTDEVGTVGVQPNLLVHGDCLDALGALRGDATYDGAVRLAYVDPPFNTGERFADYQDAMDRGTWLAAMAERLRAAWDLLRPDGTLWVHCDDSEQASLRVLMDDLFGRASFVATVVWQRRYSRENRRAFSTAHDYLHVFAPAGPEWKHHRNRLPRNDRPGTWRDGDGDPRGHWSTVSLVAQGGHGTKEQFYAIALPSGRVVEPPPGSCWRVTRERFAALERDGLIWCGPDGDNVPRRKVFRDDAQGLVPSTWWTHRGGRPQRRGQRRAAPAVPRRAPVLDAEARAPDGAHPRDRQRPRRPRARPVPRARARPRRSRTRPSGAGSGSSRAGRPWPGTPSRACARCSRGAIPAA